MRVIVCGQTLLGHGAACDVFRHCLLLLAQAAEWNICCAWLRVTLLGDVVVQVLPGYALDWH